MHMPKCTCVRHRSINLAKHSSLYSPPPPPPPPPTNTHTPTPLPFSSCNHQTVKHAPSICEHTDPPPSPPLSEQPTCGGRGVTHSASPTRPIFQQPFVNGTVITLLFYPVQPTNDIVPHYAEVSTLLFRRWCEPCQRFLDRQSSIKIIIIQKQGECVFLREKKQWLPYTHAKTTPQTAHNEQKCCRVSEPISYEAKSEGLWRKI